MSANLKKAQQYIEKVLKKEWGKLSFTYELDKDSLDVTNSHLTLNNHTDDITIAINIYSGGMANFRAVFDKADMTGNMLALINQFNRENAFFCALFCFLLLRLWYIIIGKPYFLMSLYRRLPLPSRFRLGR